jgi:hypothetical protein
MRTAVTWRMLFFSAVFAAALVMIAGPVAAAEADAQSKGEAQKRVSDENEKKEQAQTGQEQKVAGQSQKTPSQGAAKGESPTTCPPESLVNTLEDIYGFDKGTQKTSAETTAVAESQSNPKAEAQKTSDEEQQAVQWRVRKTEPKKDD